MVQQKNSIAMVSPSQNAYSETFIQEQKKGLDGNVFYYYGGFVPTYLEGYGKLLNRYITMTNKVKRKAKATIFNAKETAFIHSLKKHNIKVVLAQYGITAHHLVKICKYVGIPLITHFHGYDASISSVVKKCNNYNEVFTYSRFVIAVSASMKAYLIHLGCPKEKVIYNPCAPHDIFFKINPLFSQNTFLGLGRFVDKKAPYYTILAFNNVLKKYPEIKLMIGGDGPLYEVCKNLVKHLKIEDKVSLPGVMSRDQFLANLTTSIAFVQHSITAISGDQEGTPVAILEASAAGLPVIATKHAGIPDVIIDGETGFLVDEHDVDAMAQKMILLIENKQLAITLGNNGKERIKTNYNMKNHLGVLNNLLVQAIHNE